MTPKERANKLCKLYLKQLKQYKLISMSMINDKQIASDLSYIYVEGVLSILDKHLDKSKFNIMNDWNDTLEELNKML